MSEPVITDHAILRYIERVCEVDLDKLRAVLMTDSLKAALASGATSLKTDACTFIIEGGAVITVLGPKMKRSRKARRLRWLGAHPEQSQ